MRDLQWDQPKPFSQIKKELGKVCSVPGCGQPLTHMQGPGSESLCRDHQLRLVEYGGVGKVERPHTFHRKWVCDECGKDVSLEVDKKYPGLKEKDPATYNRLCRNRIIGDHIVRRSDGGEDTEENIQSLCLDCNSDKTILSEDYRKGNKAEQLKETKNGTN